MTDGRGGGSGAPGGGASDPFLVWVRGAAPRGPAAPRPSRHLSNQTYMRRVPSP